MKNSVKITIVLGTITSFFSIYPMMKPHIYQMSPYSYLFEENELTQINPLLHMNDLPITENGPPSLIGMTYTNNLSQFLSVYPKAGTKTKNDDPLYTDKGLALILTAFKVFKESDRVRNKETLKTICDAISEGTPVTSKYIALKPDRPKGPVTIFSRDNPTSIFESIENFFKSRSLDPNLTYKKRLLMEAIFQAERNRRERLAYVRNGLTTDAHEKLGIDIPQKVIPVIAAHLPESSVDEDSRAKVFAAAEQKFNEELDS